MKITSILAGIATEVFAASDLESARGIISERLNESKIKEEDKTKMLSEIAGKTSLRDLHRYLANALLKYEGLGVQI